MDRFVVLPQVFALLLIGLDAPAINLEFVPGKGCGPCSAAPLPPSAAAPPVTAIIGMRG